jgi:hypothetical protein
MMDLSKYGFIATACARTLDEIEARLGVKFNRQEMFDQEDCLNRNYRGNMVWSFKFSKDGTAATFSVDGERDREGVRTCPCGHHVEFVASPKGYPSGNALECALGELKSAIPAIQALRTPQPTKATMRQFTPSERETITDSIKTINQNLRANLDPAAIIAAYEQTDPNNAVGIAVTIPADFNQPATFEVRSGHSLSSGALPLSDRLILATTDDKPYKNMRYLTTWSTNDTQTEWLKTHRIPPSDGIDELVAELVETCSRDKGVRVRYIKDGSLFKGELGILKKNAEDIRALHTLYRGKSCALDLYYRLATDTPCRSNLNFRLASDAPKTDCSTHVAFTFSMHSDLKGVLQDLIRRIKASGQG